MWYIELKHSGDRDNSMFKCGEDEGEAKARYTVECGIQAKYRASFPGATVVTLFLDTCPQTKLQISS